MYWWSLNQWVTLNFFFELYNFKRDNIIIYAIHWLICRNNFFSKNARCSIRGIQFIAGIRFHMQKHTRSCTWSQKYNPLCIKFRAINGKSVISCRNPRNAIVISFTPQKLRASSVTHDETLQVFYVARLRCMIHTGVIHSQSWWFFDVPNRVPHD